MRELFIYWHVSAQDASAALAAAQAWQDRLQRECPRLSATLYRRDENAENGNSATQVTMMEVYAARPQSGVPLLDAALEQRLIDEGDSVLGPWLLGPRKVEVFVRCEPG